MLRVFTCGRPELVSFLTFPNPTRVRYLSIVPRYCYSLYVWRLYAEFFFSKAQQPSWAGWALFNNRWNERKMHFWCLLPLRHALSPRFSTILFLEAFKIAEGSIVFKEKNSFCQLKSMQLKYYLALFREISAKVEIWTHGGASSETKEKVPVLSCCLFLNSRERFASIGTEIIYETAVKYAKWMLSWIIFPFVCFSRN